jgi:outer membrane protein insertion porin family
VADDGRIQFGGRQYRLRDSRVEFRPDRGLVPTLAVSGETRVADYTVFLRLSGTADELETALSSDPPLGERDLQTLLVTGQRETLGRDSSSDQNAVGAVSGDVLGFAGQFLGFDAVTVSTTDDLALVSSDVDPALRLTVSKRIGRRFELVLSDNLDDNELTWVIIYRPRPGFEFRVLSRDNTEFTGEFRQEFQFGPGVSSPRTPPRRRQASDRVADVTVSGEPGFAPADVLTATSLRAGDEFDFSRWLEDRDRIAGLYQQRGYFAARIVPTRRRLEAERDQQRVALDYRVTRGPRTVLLVTGYAVPSEVEATLRQTWSESVLIDLLEADLARVMRGHMVDVGFLRAAIAVDVDTSQPDVVTVAVKVDPGPQSTERRLAFSGNTVLSEKELLATIEASPGLVSPWRDPAPLVETLQAAYAARGYLAMTATPGAVAFAGGTATLPIVVAEGPLARVASITVNGSNRVGQSAAAAATGLTIGGPYVTGGERSARAALERFYRNLGYRDVAVELRSTVDAAKGRVDVTVAVEEGAQHVVRAVRTTGVESTREATVDRAVQIEPGSPASPAVADATRRRLYDVGTFRSAEVTFAPVGTRTDDTVPVDAIVTVQESKRFLLLYGIEATNQYQSLFDQRVTSGGVAADLRDRNFLGRGWTLGAGVRYEPSFRSARVLNTVPRLGAKRIRTNVYADLSSEERTRTEDVILLDDETTVSIEQRWRPRTPVELSWGYQFNRRDLRFLDAHTDQAVIDLKGYLASLASAIVVDRRDNMFDAKRGWLVSTTVEWGLRPLGSDFDYLRTVVRASHYQPAGPLTLASNVRWGDILAFRGQPPVSALDLFYTAGGTQTVRGYQQDSLSAYHLEVQGQRVPLGGTKLLVLNQEVRFPLFWLLSGAAFADAGNTFTDEKGIVFGDLAVGAGIGLRIRTPLAPVRIDLGFPVAGKQGQSGARWHFSIGQIF